MITLTIYIYIIITFKWNLKSEDKYNHLVRHLNYIWKKKKCNTRTFTVLNDFKNRWCCISISTESLFYRTIDRLDEKDTRLENIL